MQPWLQVFVYCWYYFLQNLLFFWMCWWFFFSASVVFPVLPCDTVWSFPSSLAISVRKVASLHFLFAWMAPSFASWPLHELSGCWFLGPLVLSGTLSVFCLVQCFLRGAKQGPFYESLFELADCWIQTWRPVLTICSAPALVLVRCLFPPASSVFASDRMTSLSRSIEPLFLHMSSVPSAIVHFGFHNKNGKTQAPFLHPNERRKATGSKKKVRKVFLLSFSL